VGMAANFLFFLISICNLKNQKPTVAGLQSLLLYSSHLLYSLRHAQSVPEDMLSALYVL
jgi:hypothetical protein